MQAFTAREYVEYLSLSEMSEECNAFSGRDDKEHETALDVAESLSAVVDGVLVGKSGQKFKSLDEVLVELELKTSCFDLPENFWLDVFALGAVDGVPAAWLHVVFNSIEVIIDGFKAGVFDSFIEADDFIQFIDFMAELDITPQRLGIDKTKALVGAWSCRKTAQIELQQEMDALEQCHIESKGMKHGKNRQV